MGNRLSKLPALKRRMLESSKCSINLRRISANWPWTWFAISSKEIQPSDQLLPNCSRIHSSQLVLSYMTLKSSFQTFFQIFLTGSLHPWTINLMQNVVGPSGFLPSSLPASCLTMAPRLDMLEQHNSRKPLSEMNMNMDQESPFRVPNSPLTKDSKLASITKKKNNIKMQLMTLKEQLHHVLKSKPSRDTLSSIGDYAFSLWLKIFLPFSRIDVNSYAKLNF